MRISDWSSDVCSSDLRDRYFDGDLFADPAWDMLLDLYLAAERNTRPVSISSLCIASAVPATTALRWIKTFEDLQLISRRADPSDGRRIFIQLVSETKRQMDEDRKSGVEGKRGSGRVDHGGGRSI